MKIIISYNLPTACGSWIIHQVVANSLEEADKICAEIERAGYVVEDVTRDVYED